MSVQILIQGKLLGVDNFLTSDPDSSDETIAARSLWVALVCEVVPRALLAELSLARVLLGSSGAGQFLLVLPDAVREPAEAFLIQSAERVASATHGTVRLIWAVTENLGDWTVVRKRLQDEMSRKSATPLAASRSFAPSAAAETPDSIFTASFAHELETATSIGWSPDSPSVLTAAGGKHTWSLSANLSLDGITLARHFAPAEELADQPNDLPDRPASTHELAARAAGSPAWGVLRGDVDLFALRLRRAQSVEEHVQLCMLYKHFFAGEVHAICLGGEFWRRVTILYTGGDDFTVYGAWDALVLFAGEMERTFHRFADENLRDFPGAEGKTVTMALALAGEHDSLAAVLDRAGRNLAIAKASDKDCIYLFDRVVEWNQLADAAELKEAVNRVAEEFRAAGRQFLAELTRLYSRASSPLLSPADHEKLLRRAYRFQRRYNRVAFSKREKEFARLRSHLISEIVGRNIRPAAGKQLRIRPAGVVALEWARLSKSV